MWNMKCIITGNNWSHWHTDKRFKERFESRNIKPFNIFTTKDSYICNITHNTESTAV
jgi:hypothetical protein